MKRVLLALIVLLIVSPTLSQDEEVTLTVVTHDSFSASDDVLASFEAETGIKLQILESGDAGLMVNQSILSKENPLGDVMYGVDNTFLSRALEADLFIPYESPLLEKVADELVIDPEHRVTPIDYGDVCLNYDVPYFVENDLPLPDSLKALTDTVYKSLLVVENPATSSPGLAFLLATVAEFGAEGDYTYLDFWAELVENDVLVTDGWEDAYFGQFTAGGGDGTRPLVVSYASSPPFTLAPVTDWEQRSRWAAKIGASIIAEATPPVGEEGEPVLMPTTGSIVADGTCFRQIEFVGILQGTNHVEAAQRFVDFMLSVEFQEDMPLQMYVFPVNEDAELPEEFVQYAAIPENPVYMDIEEIDANRAEWIQAWTETVLR